MDKIDPEKERHPEAIMKENKETTNSVSIEMNNSKEIEQENETKEIQQNNTIFSRKSIKSWCQHLAKQKKLIKFS